MLKRIADLANRAKAEWSEDARKRYDATSVSFDTRFAARTELGAMLAEGRKAHYLAQTDRPAGVAHWPG